jgi:hypothetical protein
MTFEQTMDTIESHLKAQQKEWARLDGINTRNWTETMTWQEMQESRYQQMGFKKSRNVNGKIQWVKTRKELNNA